MGNGARKVIIDLENSFVDLHNLKGKDFVDQLVAEHETRGRIDPAAISRALEMHLEGLSVIGSDFLRKSLESLHHHSRIDALNRAGFGKEVRRAKLAQTQDERGEQLRQSFDMAFRSVNSLPDDVIERIRTKIMENLDLGAGSTEQVLRALIEEEIEKLDIQDPAELREAIRTIWDKTRHDLQRVIRSESINAYSRVQLQEWADRGIKTCRRRSIDDDRTCAICRELSRPGINEYSVEDLLKLDYPVSQDPDSGDWLTHPNCFLPGTLVQGEILMAWKSSYQGPAREIRTAGGICLRVTPNHPIVTTDGVIAAKNLAPGYHLPRYLGVSDRPTVDGCENQEQEPVRIEDVFHTIRDSSSSAAKCFTALSDNFYGDATNFIGKVEVVGSKGILGDKWAFFEPLIEKQFVGSPMGSSFESGNRSTNIDFRTVAGRSLVDSLCSRHSAPFKPLRFGSSADLNALLREMASYCESSDTGGIRECLHRLAGQVSSRQFCDADNALSSTSDFDAALQKDATESAIPDTSLGSELLDRFSGLISLDEVVEVVDFEFSGHVYDLQSTCGLIVADGIVSKQCRCWFEPIIEDVWAEIEGIEADLFGDLTRGDATATDVPIDARTSVEKALREHKDLDMKMAFVPKIVDLPEWQKSRKQELEAEVGDRAEIVLESEIAFNAVTEWTDPKTGTHYVAGQAQDISHPSTPVSRAAGGRLWDKGMADHSWVSSRYRDKKAETEATIEVEGYQIFGGEPFPTEVAAESARDYFVESYALYVTQPYILQTTDATMYDWLAAEIFGGREFLQRGGLK